MCIPAQLEERLQRDLISFKKISFSTWNRDGFSSEDGRKKILFSTLFLDTRFRKLQIKIVKILYVSCRANSKLFKKIEQKAYGITKITVKLFEKTNKIVVSFLRDKKSKNVANSCYVSTRLGQPWFFVPGG